MPVSSGDARLVLSLFVTGETTSSLRALAQLERWLGAAGTERVELNVIDTQERPDLAEQERVLATPALVRRLPLPRRKIIGDLRDWEAVLQALDLEETERS